MLFPLVPEDPMELGGHRLLARLGGGGMGTVYLARSARGRTVALKTVHPQFADDLTLRTRFRLETDAARVMGGRYGAQVFDADPFAPLPWLATEYVPGPSLDEAVAAGGPLPGRTVRALGAVLCGALGQLHASDVVHRDLKPSNILISAFGPKLIDFGIARAVGDTPLTHTGTAAGTPAFMSPEQAAGLEHTPAGDVFALAGVLVFAATGHGPFGTGRPADLVYRVRHAEPELTEVPAALLPILSACLSKDPGNRPDTAELAGQFGPEEPQFADILPDGILADIARRGADVWRVQPHRPPLPPHSAHAAPVSAKQPSPGMSRRGLLAVAGGSVLGLGALGTGIWAWSGRGDDTTTPAAKPTPTATPSARRTRPANVPERAVWWATLDKADTGFAPTEVGDHVVVMSRKGLVAFDARTGSRKWISDAVKQPLQVTTDGERIYAFTPPHTKDGAAPGLSSLSIKDGRPETLDADLSELFADDRYLQPQALAADKGAVYLFAHKSNVQYSWDHDLEHRVLAFDLRTGKERWHHDFSFDRMQMVREFAAGLADGRLVLTRVIDRMAVGKDVQSNDWLGALRTSDGAMVLDTNIPRLALGDQSPLPGQLAVDAGNVCLKGKLLSLYRTTDGKKAWEFGEGRDNGRVGSKLNPYGRPAIKDGVVYANEEYRNLIAVDARSGTLLWDKTFGDVPISFDIPPLVGEKFVYVPLESTSGRTQIAAVDRHTQRTAWTMDVPGGLGAGFAIHRRARLIVWASGDYICAMPLE